MGPPKHSSRQEHERTEKSGKKKVRGACLAGAKIMGYGNMGGRT